MIAARNHEEQAEDFETLVCEVEGKAGYLEDPRSAKTADTACHLFTILTTTSSKSCFADGRQCLFQLSRRICSVKKEDLTEKENEHVAGQGAAIASMSESLGIPAAAFTKDVQER